MRREGKSNVKSADRLREELASLSLQREVNQAAMKRIEEALGQLFKEVVEHPYLTMEEARLIPVPSISRNTAYRMAREAK